MVQIREQFIPDAVKPKFTVGGKKVVFPMVPRYITIHETANTAKGADDVAHGNLQAKGNSRSASWHITVDQDSATQSIPFNECALHAGDGSNGTGNRQSIAIEICVNEGADFAQAVRNAAEITRNLMRSYNISIDHVVQHNHWTGKDCPHFLRNGEKGVRWNDFLALLNEPIVNVPHPAPPITNKPAYPGRLLKLTKPMMRGEDVKAVQRVLSIPADGIFGKQTDASVRAYQKRVGLTVDGIVGQHTWSALF